MGYILAPLVGLPQGSEYPQHKAAHARRLEETVEVRASRRSMRVDSPNAASRVQVYTLDERDAAKKRRDIAGRDEVDGSESDSRAT